MTTEKLRLALVGCGGIARAHLYGIQHYAPRIEVVALVDSNIDSALALKERVDVPCFATMAECFESVDVDAVDLMLPHNIHEWGANEVYKAQKHLCLEKPISADIESAERILQGAQDAGIKLMVAEQAQYWMEIVRARELIDEGEIGEVITGRAMFYDPVTPVDPDNLPWRYNYEQRGGGIAIDGGAHWIRPMRMMLGEIESVSATTSRHIPEMEGESLVHSLLRFESGVIGTFSALHNMAPFGRSDDFRITGTEGEIVIEQGREGRLMLYNQKHTSGLEIMSSWESKLTSYGAELADFASFVLDDTPPAAPPEYAMGELRAAKAMYRSAESGQWETV